MEITLVLLLLTYLQLKSVKDHWNETASSLKSHDWGQWGHSTSFLCISITMGCSYSHTIRIMQCCTFAHLRKLSMHSFAYSKLGRCIQQTDKPVNSTAGLNRGNSPYNYRTCEKSFRRLRIWPEVRTRTMQGRIKVMQGTSQLKQGISPTAWLQRIP